jgi:aromatic ring hydroxylase
MQLAENLVKGLSKSGQGIVKLFFLLWDSTPSSGSLNLHHQRMDEGSPTASQFTCKIRGPWDP